MKLLVHELKATEMSGFYTPKKNVNVHAIRPHLYRHNWASGSLAVEVYDSGLNLIATSNSVAIADIKLAGALNYFHGYVTFEVSVGLKKNEQYKLKLISSGGYSFSEASYVGWCNGVDLGKYDPTYAALHYNYPLDIEIWERKQK